MSLMNPERPGFLHEIEPQPQQEKGNCIGRNFILLFFLKKQIILLTSFGCAGSLLRSAGLAVVVSRGYSSCSSWLLTAAASLLVEHGLWGLPASVVAIPGLRSCGTWA